MMPEGMLMPSLGLMANICTGLEENRNHDIFGGQAVLVDIWDQMCDDSH